MIAYLVFAAFVGVVEIKAAPGVAASVIQPTDLLAQLLFTPLLACWTVWVAIAISTRSSDVRVAQQLGIIASLPPVFVTVMIALIIGGQTLTSLAFDRIGFLGVSVRELTTPRAIGALLTVVGVLLVNFGDRVEGFIGRN